MKKTAVGVLCFMIFGSAFVWAQSPDEARLEHRKEMKKIKDEQRIVRKSGTAAKSEPSKWSEFWAKEGARSGLGNPGGSAGNVLQSMNPVPFFKTQAEQYNARKNAAKK